MLCRVAPVTPGTVTDTWSALKGHRSRWRPGSSRKGFGPGQVQQVGVGHGECIPDGSDVGESVGPDLAIGQLVVLLFHAIEQVTVGVIDRSDVPG